MARGPLLPPRECASNTVIFSGLNLYIWREVKLQTPRGKQRALYT